MNNLRKFKKKRRSRVPNAEEQAEQKLFEISHFQDEEEASDLDHFIQRFEAKQPPKPDRSSHKHSRSQHPTDPFLLPKTSKIASTFSLS